MLGSFTGSFKFSRRRRLSLLPAGYVTLAGLTWAPMTTGGTYAAADTQACEMIIAKSWRADDIAASVYGVVHTSVAPLATFTADWNALTSRVEVICTAPSANGVDVRIFATEIRTAV